jgi:hypothetical protein
MHPFPLFYCSKHPASCMDSGLFRFMGTLWTMDRPHGLLVVVGELFDLWTGEQV